jgi:hypothetical protein
MGMGKGSIRKTHLSLSLGRDGYWLHIDSPKHKGAVWLSGPYGAPDHSRTLGPALEEALALGCVRDNRKG